MAGLVTLFDPTAPWNEARAPDARPVMAGLAGATVGFIDNAKPNFGDLVDDLAQVLVARYGVARVIKRKKPAASIPARDDLIDDIARECDLVIAGSGD